MQFTDSAVQVLCVLTGSLSPCSIVQGGAAKTCNYNVNHPIHLFLKVWNFVLDILKLYQYIQ